MIRRLQFQQRVTLHLPEGSPTRVTRLGADVFGGRDVVVDASEPSIAQAAWPAVDASMMAADTVELPVQIMGKVRSRVTVPADADQAAIEEAALADERIRGLLEGRTVRKVIVVPGRIVNVIV